MGNLLIQKLKYQERDYSKFVEQDYLHNLDNIQVSDSKTKVSRKGLL